MDGKQSTEKFYEVVRNTPIGNVVMGRFRNLEKAKTLKEEWNSQLKPNSFDKAWINEAKFDD